VDLDAGDGLASALKRKSLSPAAEVPTSTIADSMASRGALPSRTFQAGRVRSGTGGV